LNPFRNGNPNFYGPGSSFTIDTTQPFKVVTQFITNDGTDEGDLVEIKRFYVQNGKKFDFPNTNVPGLGSYNSLTNTNCANQKRVFEEAPTFLSKGGMKAMGESMKRGMVLVLSLWDDTEAFMLWLDSDYPLNLDPSKPGVKRGPCARDSGKPKDVESRYPSAHTGFSNVRFGPLGTTVQFEEDGVTVKQ
jgi:cellulose 1,4-beta-cellobiosidase